MHAVRDHALLPGSAGMWGEVSGSLLVHRDVEVWPYTVGLVVKLVTFLGTLLWPAAGADLGSGGVSFI